MITKYEVKSLKLNANLRGKPKGSVVRVRVDSNGTPIEKYWRDRIKDSKIDKCVEFVRKAENVISTKKVLSKKDKGGKD